MTKDYLITIFNNREIVLTFYFVIFSILAMTQVEIRKSIIRVFKTLTSTSMLFLFLIMVYYIVPIIYALHIIKLWDLTILKDSIYWTFGVGFILIINSNKAIKEDHYFKKLLKDNFKLTLILEFIIGLYVFSILTEFILIPIVIFLSIILGVSEVRNEYAQVKNVLQVLFGIFGIIYFVYSLYKIFGNINDFASYSTLKSFLFPIAMTILFIPFLYFCALHMQYEIVFARLISLLKDDNSLYRYTKKRIYISANFSLSKLKKIKPRSLLRQCKTKEDIKRRIKETLEKKQ